MQNNKRILVIILFLGMAAQISNSACLNPTLPYAYLSSCYAECPWVPPIVTYLDTTANSCVTGNNIAYLACTGPTYFADDSTKKCVLSI